MSNVIKLPRNKVFLDTVAIKIETTMLEDGSFWYRCTETKTGDWLDWVLLELNNDD